MATSNDPQGDRMAMRSARMRVAAGTLPPLDGARIIAAHSDNAGDTPLHIVGDLHVDRIDSIHHGD